MRRSALQSILDDMQRLVYSRGTVVMACQLAQFVRNSLRGVYPHCGVHLPVHSGGHMELAGHAPLHPERERILRVAPVQERGSTQHPARESHRRTEISTTRAERNVVDENGRIVAPQAHALDIALAALAHTGCGATTLHMHR